MDQPKKNSQTQNVQLELGDQAGAIDASSEGMVSDPVLDATNPLASEYGIPTIKKASSRSRRRLFCFDCNRREDHSITTQRRWFYSFLLGLTFGMIYLIGPYRCNCCGAKRLMAFDSLNAWYWVRLIGEQSLSKPKKRSRR